MNLKDAERPANVVDYLIIEQIRNWQTCGEDDVGKIVQKLVQQTPHRIYFSPEQVVCRALLYRGEYRFQSYLEILRPVDSYLQKVKGEFLSSASSGDLETQIDRLRRGFDLRGDLLLKPDQIFVDDSQIYTHVGFTNKEPVVCQYNISPLGPRSRFLGVGKEHINGKETREIEVTLLDHIWRF